MIRRMTDPNFTPDGNATNIFQMIGALLAGILGGEGWRRAKKPKKDLGDVVTAIRSEGQQTRKAIYETSQEQSRQMAALANNLSKLEGIVTGSNGR